MAPTKKKKNDHEPIRIAFEWNGVLEDDATWTGDVGGLLGYTSEELSGNFFDIVHKDDYGFYMKALKKSVGDKEPFYLDFRVIKKDGTPILINVQGFLILNEKENIERWLGFVTDITQQRKQEEKLKESEERLSKFMNSATLGISLFDKDFKFRDANKAVLRYMGLTKKNEVVGKHMTEVIPDIKSSGRYKLYKEVVRTGKPYTIENYVPHPKYFGDRHLSLHAFKVGEGLGIIVNDITKRQEVERDLMNRTKDLEAAKAQLERDNAQDEAIFASVGDGMIVTDDKGRITKVNKAAEGMLGWSIHEMMGKNLNDMVGIEDEEMRGISPQNRPAARALATGEKTIASKYHYIRKDGSEFPVEVSTTPIRLNGNTVGTTQVFRDITKDMEIDKAKNEFVSLASHQLRTPLSTISWYAESLLKKARTKSASHRQEYLTEIYRACRRMTQLVSDLLNVSRIELGTVVVEPTSTDIIAVIHAILDELRPQIIDKELQIEELYAKKKMVIHVDPKLIQIALQNLLSNAVKYTPHKGQVTIEVYSKEKKLFVRITDTGYGIPHGDQAKVFTKLFRGENVKELDTDGTGLGLYIAKSMINQSGGDILFDSQVNKGTTFYITVPLDPPEYK